MNRRRVLAIVTAVVLTLFGTIVLIAYVNSAEERALAGSELVEILVAAQEIPASTPAASLADKVVTRLVPEEFVPGDAVRNLESLGEKVTLERVLEGEPIVERQFGERSSVRPGGGGEIEEGLEIVTVALEPQRALGGQVTEGDLVGVIVSVEPDSGENSSIDGTGGEATTAMVLAGVPVTDVRGGADPETGEASDLIMVSLQVDQPDAERVIFGAEFGRLWLTRQGEGLQPDDQKRTRTNIYSGLGR
jgi:pilus assembly protein CpaB